MNILEALFWGLFASGSLLIGQFLAPRLADNRRLVGQIMGFGAGAMVSAIAYDLVPETVIEERIEIGIAFLLGALVYYVADRWADHMGGADRQSIDAPKEGSGAAMFIGALLDGIPESFVLGISLGVGEFGVCGGNLRLQHPSGDRRDTQSGSDRNTIPHRAQAVGTPDRLQWCRCDLWRTDR